MCLARLNEDVDCGSVQFIIALLPTDPTPAVLHMPFLGPGSELGQRPISRAITLRTQLHRRYLDSSTRNGP
jgi:hypothetical protein